MKIKKCKNPECNKEFKIWNRQKEYCSGLCNRNHWDILKGFKIRCKICGELCYSSIKICIECQRNKEKIMNRKKEIRISRRDTLDKNLGSKLFDFILKENPILKRKILEARDYEKEYMKNYWRTK